MLNKKNCLLLSFIYVFLLSSQVQAIDKVPSKPDTTTYIEVVDSIEVEFKSYTQFAIGFSHRTDHHQLIDFSPMFQTALYYHFSNKLAGKFVAGISRGNKFKSATKETIQYQNFKLEAGFRWNILSSVVILYHENGLEYNHYYEPKSKIWEHRIGVNFVLGLLYEVTNKFSMTISFGKSLNTASFSTHTIITPQVKSIGLKNDKFFEEVFNPTSIQLMIYRKL